MRKLTEKLLVSCWISTPSIRRSAVVFCSPFSCIRSSARPYAAWSDLFVSLIQTPARDQYARKCVGYRSSHAEKVMQRLSFRLLM